MSAYIGPFYIKDSDVFTFIALLICISLTVAGISLPFITIPDLLLFTILALILRGLLPATRASTVAILFLTTVLFSILFSTSVAILYLVISGILLVLTKQL